MSGLATIDLFAGAGGLSLGARDAGAEVRLMVDMDHDSCSTVRANHHHGDALVVEADATTLSGSDLRQLAGVSANESVIIIGGPPCQPFSKAAYWTDSGSEARYRQARARGEDATRPTDVTVARPDPRRTLVGEFWRLVQETNADGFLMENVPSILHPRNREIVSDLVRDADAAGYKVELARVNAAEYGVPQRRSRVAVLGSKGSRPTVSAPTHTLGADCEDSALLPAASAGEVLSPYAHDAYFEPEEVVTGRWADHLRDIPAGWNYKHHTAWAGHQDPTWVAETRFWNFLLKLSPHAPSWTIAANPGPWTGPFHWSSRRLRTPELAALQGFPRDYQFRGTRRERVRQIGNAVPPALGAVLFRALTESLASVSTTR